MREKCVGLSKKNRDRRMSASPAKMATSGAGARGGSSLLFTRRKVFCKKGAPSTDRHNTVRRNTGTGQKRGIRGKTEKYSFLPAVLPGWSTIVCTAAYTVLDTVACTARGTVVGTALGTVVCRARGTVAQNRPAGTPLHNRGCLRCFPYRQGGESSPVELVPTLFLNWKTKNSCRNLLHFYCPP